MDEFYEEWDAIPVDIHESPIIRIRCCSRICGRKPRR